MSNHNERGIPIVTTMSSSEHVEGFTFYTVQVMSNVVATAALRSARALHGGVTKAQRAQRAPRALTTVIGVLSALPPPTKVFIGRISPQP